MRHELLNHALGDPRRGQGVSGGDRPHRADQLGGVLEHEATGPDAQRLVDVLVQVEGREDEDARGAVGREDAPRRLEPVELGHADVHQHDGGMEARGLADCVEPLASATTSMSSCPDNSMRKPARSASRRDSQCRFCTRSSCGRS
jgi:hypothetical protein